MDRRTFLKASVLGAGVATAPMLFLNTGGAFAAPISFNADLKIPPLLEGWGEQNNRVFELSLQNGSSAFVPGYQTPTFGISGAYLGPVIRARKGDRVTISVRNQLEEPSTLHWHGVKLPGEMDGGPHQSIAPGEIWRPEFMIDQPASMQWYHSHAWHRTGEQVFKGLAGLFIIDDDQSDGLGLPNEYGVDDIPLVLQDRSFNRDGSFRYVAGMHQRMAGLLGNVMLVNGTVGPHLHTSKTRTRFRILNGSNARIYNLAFDDQRPFQQIASDGGLLAEPVTLSRIRLAPGERAELVVDIKGGEEVFLQHQPMSVPGGGMMMAMTAGIDAAAFDILRITSSATDSSGLPALPRRLATLPPLPSSPRGVSRQFVLDTQMMVGSTINGKQMNLQRIDHKVVLGEEEMWEFVNRSPMPHPMHIHGVQFRVLSRNGHLPAKNEQGFKDTVLIHADEVVRILASFDHPASSRFPYMFHCHNLEHEDGGMMGQFTVEHLA